MSAAGQLTGWPSEYLFVRQEPSASITGRLVKFSLAISSMPRLQAGRGGGPLMLSTSWRLRAEA